MLDWNKIDNDKIFQRIVNHLFALECNSPGFIPSSPYIGADGGWDGYYKGYYAYEGEDGVWSIQAKWTTKFFKDAISSLKPKIKEELQKAKNNNVNHLRIATNAKLTVDQVRELEGLNEGEVTTLRIWHREELTRRVELQPFLRCYFFGLPQHPMFIPWDTYFGESERHLLHVTAAKIPKFEDYLSKVRTFILSQTSSILLIHSPGGYGKSHLLREIAQIAHRIDPERQPWMIRVGYRKIEDTIQDEIIDGRKYLLIFDDADRFLDEIKSLLSFCKYKSNISKVILASRTSGLQSIYNIIKGLRCEELCEEINISSWSKDDLIRLLRMASGLEKVKDEEIIATVHPNPFLIVWIGKQIRNEPTLDLKKVKEKFVNDIDYEVERCLKNVLNPSEIKDFIINLACITPFSKEDNGILKILSDRFNLELDTINETIENLKSAGILRVVGKSLRFNPDMKGDFYLAHKLEKTPDPKEVERLIQIWLPVSAEKVFINLEAAARYAETTPLKKILSGIVDFWIEKAESTPSFTRIKRLNLTEKIAYLIPENCLNLLYAYLDSGTPPLDNSYLKVLGFGDITITTDDYGPLIIKLMKISSLRKDVVEIIEKIEIKGIGGTYYNYKPTSLIKDSVSPLYNNPDLILNTLNLFKVWLDRPNDSRIKLLSAALSEVLASSCPYSKSTIGALTWGEKVLRNTPEIRKIRDKALRILKNMITKPSLKIKLAGIQVAEEIGRTRTGRVSEEKLPLSKKISKERKEIVEEIGHLVSPKRDFQLLNAIENLFLKWWAQEIPGADKAKDYLHKFPRSSEYITFRYFVSSDYVIKDFDSIVKQAPVKSRWSWFVNNIMYKTVHLKPQDFQVLVESLNKKYNTENQIVRFLRNLNGKISSYNLWSHPPIITCWIKLNSSVFSSIRRNSHLWHHVPERFKKEIDLAIVDFDRKFIEKLTDEVFSELPNASISKIDTFLRSLERDPPERDVLEDWLSELLEKGNSETRALVIYHLPFILKKIKEIDFIMKILHLTVSKEKELDSQIVHNLSFVLRSLRKDLDCMEEKSADSFRKELLQRLKDVPELDFEALGLLDFALQGIDSVVDFLEHRFKKSKEAREKNVKDRKYKAIPFDGIKCIVSQIKTFNDYEKFMTKVISWYEKDIFWRSFYLKSLMKPVKTLLNSDSKKLYIEEYIEKQLEMGDIKNAIIASKFLPLDENTILIFMRVAEEAITSGKSRDIEELLYHKIYPDTVLSSTLGKPPLALVARKNLFQKMYERSKPGKLRMLVKHCIEEIDRTIEDHIKRDEEFLNPRG